MGSNSNATQGAVIVVGVHFLTLYAAVLAVKGEGCQGTSIPGNSQMQHLEKFREYLPIFYIYYNLERETAEGISITFQMYLLCILAAWWVHIYTVYIQTQTYDVRLHSL